MTHEFRMSRFNRGAGVIFLIILAALPFFLGIFQYVSPVVAICIGIISIPLGYWTYRSGQRSKLIMDERTITLVDSFRTTTMQVPEVKGYRYVATKDNTYLELQSKGENPTSLRIVYKSFENSELICDIIMRKFHDLNKMEKEHGMKELLQNENLGHTIGERKGKLKKMTRLVNWYSAVAVLSFILFCFFPNKWTISIGLAIPLAGVMVLYYGKGIIYFFTNKNNDPTPTIYISVLLLCVVLMFKAYNGYQVLTWSHAWLPASLIALFYLILAGIWGVNPAKDLAAQIGILLCASALYGLSATLFLNSFLDKTSPQVFSVKVLNQSIVQGKHNTYYLNLSSWGSNPYGTKESVSHSFYDHTNIGDSVNVMLHEGKFKIAWYEVKSIIFPPQ